MPLLIDQNDSPLLSEDMRQLLQQHFWCDFSDIIPAMAWDETSEKPQ